MPNWKALGFQGWPNGEAVGFQKFRMRDFWVMRNCCSHYIQYIYTLDLPKSGRWKVSALNFLHPTASPLAPCHDRETVPCSREMAPCSRGSRGPKTLARVSGRKWRFFYCDTASLACCLLRIFWSILYISSYEADFMDSLPFEPADSPHEKSGWVLGDKSSRILRSAVFF